MAIITGTINRIKIPRIGKINTMGIHAVRMILTQRNSIVTVKKGVRNKVDSDAVARKVGKKRNNEKANEYQRCITAW
jgi:hypothetical protein